MRIEQRHTTLARTFIDEPNVEARDPGLINLPGLTLPSVPILNPLLTVLVGGATTTKPAATQHTTAAPVPNSTSAKPASPTSASSGGGSTGGGTSSGGTTGGGSSGGGTSSGGTSGGGTSGGGTSGGGTSGGSTSGGSTSGGSTSGGSTSGGSTSGGSTSGGSTSGGSTSGGSTSGGSTSGGSTSGGTTSGGTTGSGSSDSGTGGTGTPSTGDTGTPDGGSTSASDTSSAGPSSSGDGTTSSDGTTGGDGTTSDTGAGGSVPGSISNLAGISDNGGSNGGTGTVGGTANSASNPNTVSGGKSSGGKSSGSSSIGPNGLPLPSGTSGGGSNGGGNMGGNGTPDNTAAKSSSKIGIAIGIIVAIILIVLAILYLGRRRRQARRDQDKNRWWFTRNRTSQTYGDKDGENLTGAQSVRSSFATTFDRTNSPTTEFILPPMPPMAEVGRSDGTAPTLLIDIPTSDARFSIGSQGSGSSQYLVVNHRDSMQTNELMNSSTPMSVRPFTPSESFAFPKPPDRDSGGDRISTYSRPTSLSATGTLNNSNGNNSMPNSPQIPPIPPAPTFPAPTYVVPNPYVPDPFAANPNPFADNNPFEDAQAPSSSGHAPPSTIASHSASALPTAGEFAEIEYIRRPFHPNLPDEIRVQPDDAVRVVQTFDDGWALVERLAGEQRRGLIPLDCLREPGQALPAFLAAKRVSRYSAETTSSESPFAFNAF